MPSSLARMACAGRVDSSACLKGSSTCYPIHMRPHVLRAAIAQTALSIQLQSTPCSCGRAAHRQGTLQTCHALQQQQVEQQQQQHRWKQQGFQPQLAASNLINRRNRHSIGPMSCVAADAAAGSSAAQEAEEIADPDTPPQEQDMQQPSSSQVFDFTPAESSRSQPDVIIKSISADHEFQSVARLRAEAYYAEDHSRFAASFKRQFAAQEVESLKQRTAAASGGIGKRPQLCDCLVAVEPSSGAVQGCIDIRLPQTSSGVKAIGVPEGDAAGCYLLNVVVAEEHRGLGIGKALMRAAMARAVHTWGAQRLYTHVEADNEVASSLYKSCGFKEHSSEEKYANTSALGRLVLLLAEAQDALQLSDTLWAAEQ